MKKGFTLIELIVVLGIVVIFITVATTNLVGFQNRTYLNTTVATFIDDIKQQQLKAMTGDTEGRGTLTPYGIRLEADRYILFHGTTYSPSDTSNVIISLENNVRMINTTFPQSVIVFQKGSGEINNFVNGSNTITLRNSNTNEQRVIQINRYGSITNVN